jgi:hypothetical protein
MLVVMMRAVAIHGYRSLRDLVVPLGQLNVITGANGSSTGRGGSGRRGRVADRAHWRTERMGEADSLRE